MKVRPFKIAKPIDQSLVVQVDVAYSFYNQLHQHAEIQISCIVEGNGKLIVANSVHPFKKGDIFVIGGNTPHLFKSLPNNRKSHMITLFLTPDSLGNDFFQIPELIEIKRFFTRSIGGLRIQSRKKSITHSMCRLPKAGKLQKFILFLKLINEINKADLLELTGFVPSKKISNIEGRRLQLVFDYTMNHFGQAITLSQVADLVHMTIPAFCRFFKQRTNKTYFEFLIELRIEHACQMLVHPNKTSIATISEGSGFSSISNFNRKFRKLKGMTPSAYVRKTDLTLSY
jgi:AraC-like DNA-binding protein/quercetin dioxygenase-like cupin family protein